jgi:hypothetical protein
MISTGTGSICTNVVRIDEDRHRLVAGFLLGDRRQDVEKVARRSRQAVKPRHHEHVAGFELVEDAAKLDAIGLRTAGRLAPHFRAPAALSLRT